MKKSKVFILGLMVPFMSACSCSLLSAGNFSWDEYKNDNDSLSLQSTKFKSYKLEEFTSIESKKTALQNVVTDKGSSYLFVTRYNELGNQLYKLLNCYVIASTKYYAECDSTYKAKADKYYSQYLDISKFLMNLETDIYHSSNEIKTAYFGNMTDAAIEERLSKNENSVIEADYDKIFNNYKDEGSELYLRFKQNEDRETYLDTGYDYFLRYINKANELISKISSYDNYLDYSYENDYGRDYKYNNALNFVNYVKQYFVPICANKKELTKPTNVDKNLLEIIGKKNFCYRKTSLCDYFLSYAETMDGEYLEAYNNAFKYGYYCFSDSPNSMNTAYEWGLQGTNDAVLYFSSGYQDVLSVIHEFGHYYSCTQNGGVRKYDAYDLQETYSQGNEFTFCKYLLEQLKDSQDYDTYAFYVDNKIYNTLSQIINEAAITEIEINAYTATDLTKESLINIVESTLASYQGTASDIYFMGPVLTSPCYYVSYATSLMEALQFAAMDNFETAKKNYKTLVEANGSLTMVRRWENAGLKSPFGEECFTTLANLYSDIASKY